jgi:hypothetical protein
VTIKVIQSIADVANGGGEYLVCFSDISAKYNVYLGDIKPDLYTILENKYGFSH